MTTDDGLKGLTDSVEKVIAELGHLAMACAARDVEPLGSKLNELAYRLDELSKPAANVHDSGDGEISHLRVVAKRNLKSYIERHITTDDLTKKTMLACLEELS